MTGRGLAVVAGLAADLQPAGWRLTDASGVDHRRARSLLAQDLDVVEELSQDYVGTFKTQVAGPWTLAATVEKPRGDKVLSDHGARRELAQALAEGITVHLADLRRRLRGVDRWIVQVDEPALAAVVNAQVPTASGFGRHRRVDLPEASAHLEWVVAAIADAGARGLGALVRAADPVVARRRHRGRRPLCRPRPARAGRPRRLRGGAGGRTYGRARRRARPRTPAPSSRTPASPSASSGCSTCSAWTRRWCGTSSWSRPPAGSPVRAGVGAPRARVSSRTVAANL